MQLIYYKAKNECLICNSEAIKRKYWLLVYKCVCDEGYLVKSWPILNLFLFFLLAIENNATCVSCLDTISNFRQFLLIN